jgi:hypothetical protein
MLAEAEQPAAPLQIRSVLSFPVSGTYYNALGKALTVQQMRLRNTAAWQNEATFQIYDSNVELINKEASVAITASLLTQWLQVTSSMRATAAHGASVGTHKVRILVRGEPVLTVVSRRSLPSLFGREHKAFPVKLLAKLPMRLRLKTPAGPGTLVIKSIDDDRATVTTHVVR